MSILQALVLALVQGVTEFTPVSSSAHLTLVPFVFGWHVPTIAFDVAVQLGALIALCYHFGDPLAALARTASSWSDAEPAARRRVTAFAIAAAPAVLIAIVFHAPFARTFGTPVRVSFLLGVTGFFLLSSETVVAHSEELPRDDDELRSSDLGPIAGAQAVAVVPGISRLGAVIGTAMRTGLTREAAVRFAFVLGVPFLVVQIAAELPGMFKQGLHGSVPAMLIGLIVSTITALLVIPRAVDVLDRRGLRPFGVYCILLMVAGLVTGLARG